MYPAPATSASRRPLAPIVSAYQLYQPSAAGPPATRRAVKNSSASRSYSPGGQLGGTGTPSRTPSAAGPASSASIRSSVAAISSRRVVRATSAALMIGPCLRDNRDHVRVADQQPRARPFLQNGQRISGTRDGS